ncbi:NUDIX domain-containing protein [Pelosinus sp. UFO1]|jgi:ADP-ribose pyrophosphatase YjhB (NUDIX family)|uniref:NUDIX hydrolase n=1 Tax=Pelosinus sp. UFO1 TaxID=484770 RepID=UPI0004D11B5B|nr:NUDIX domain-containing protein [Pelosinus sp. UFO1]AIF52289.1 NUDIX hydrolase [Pelosinus sp. UFO1]
MSDAKNGFFRDCDKSAYIQSSNTVDMVIFSAIDGEDKDPRRLPDKVLQILLVKKKKDPLSTKESESQQGKWALPGGFVNYEESIDEAAVRELKAETNLENVYMEQLYTWGRVYPDLRRRVISTSYMALVDREKFIVKSGEDAEDVRWFNVSSKVIEKIKSPTANGYILEKTFEIIVENEEITIKDHVMVKTIVEGHISKTENTYIENKNGLAFDHAKVIQYALDRMKNKVMYTDIAFSLMPELFTLTELQKVYEVLYSRELADAYFRKKVKRMLTKTTLLSEGKRFRPSKLYRFNPKWTEKDDEEFCVKNDE